MDICGTIIGFCRVMYYDGFFVSESVYLLQAVGFRYNECYKVNIGKMSPEIPGYVPDSLLTTTDGEDLVRLVDNIRRAPQVDEICLAMNSCPYTWSNSWSQLVRADADTSVKANYYQMFNVTVSYFDVLRIR